MQPQPYHHCNSIHDFVVTLMLKEVSKGYHPQRTYRQRLQFRLVAAQYQREPNYFKA